MASLSNGTTTWTYTYDANGLRKTRTNGTDTYTYIYNGSKLTQMTKGTDTLYFTYDAFGAPWTVRWNGTVYTYMTNLQGDVIAIVNTSNTAVVEYAYDAWGNILSTTGTMATTLGTLNPLTYRGYVYDHETELYYLQSRYYNPEWGRFLNADALVATGQGLLGNNMFAYCLNNPVTFVDPSGNIPFSDSFFGDAFQKLGETIGWWLKDTLEEAKDEHYSRNDNNPDFPQIYDEDYFSEWDDSVSANCHQFTSENRDNKKYVSPDGFYEVIYDVDGKLVTDPRDVGTYNYVSPNENPVGHFFVDVVPWIVWGNSASDSTTWYERILGFVHVYLD